MAAVQEEELLYLCLSSVLNTHNIDVDNFEMFTNAFSVYLKNINIIKIYEIKVFTFILKLLTNSLYWYYIHLWNSSASQKFTLVLANNILQKNNNIEMTPQIVFHQSIFTHYHQITHCCRLVTLSFVISHKAQYRSRTSIRSPCF